MAQEEALSLLHPILSTQFLELSSSPQGHPGLGLWMGRSFWKNSLGVLGTGFKDPYSSSCFTEEEIECDLQCYRVIHRKLELKPKAMAPHSSTLAWKIPWTSTLAWKIPWMEEPGRLQSMGPLGVGHD